MKTHPSILLIFIAALILMPGCDTPTPAEIEATPTSSFQAADKGEPLIPRVSSTLPFGGQEMPLDGNIEIIFDQAMNQSATAAAWEIYDPDGKSLEGLITWPQVATLRFTPSQELEPGTTYTATLSTRAESENGVALAEAETFIFSTLGELQISQVFPADKATDVENSAIITIAFNRPVVALQIAEERADLPSPIEISPALSGQGEWVNTSVYVFQPDESLRSSTTYTMRVPAGLGDTNGSTLENSYEWSFTTTAPRLEALELTDWVWSPQDWLTDVPLEQTFSLSFFQPMNTASVEANFVLKDENGIIVPVAFEWDAENTVLAITPENLFGLGITYNMLLSDQATDQWGGTLAEGLDWHFTSMLPPGVRATEPADNSSQEYFSRRVTIMFNSPMELDSLKDKVILSPQPAGEVEWIYNEWDWSISFYGLKPSTSYLVRLLPGASDLYGNTITRDYVFNFRTAAYNATAYLEMPYGPVIYRQGGPSDFYIRYVNVDSVQASLYQLNAAQFHALASGNASVWDYAPAEDSLLREWSQPNYNTLNDIGLQRYTLTNQVGEILPPGFYFLNMEGWDNVGPITNDQRLIMIAGAHAAVKSTRSEALVWLTDLNAGTPLEGVPLSLYDEYFNVVGHGTTDEDGLALIEIPQAFGATTNTKVRARYTAEIADESLLSGSGLPTYYVLTDTVEHLAFASTDWGSGVSPYDFGIWSNYYTLPNQPAVYVYTDRPLYRPGHPVSFKGVVRLNDDLTYSLPTAREVLVTIASYSDTVYEETLPILEFGTFDGELLLDANAALGNYDIYVSDPVTGDNIGSGYFSVAEYRKPEFQVGVTAAPEDVLSDEEFTLTLDAEFFSGGWVSNAEVEWGLFASTYTFSPGGDLSRYSFSDVDYDDYFAYEESFVYNEEIATGQAVTGEDGQLQLTFPADLSLTDTSLSFTFEATTTDFASNAVSASANVVGHQSAVYAGVRPQRYVGSVGEEQTFELVAVNWDEDTLAGQLLDVEIVERRWNSIQVQESDGTVHWESSVEEIPVASFEGIETGAQGKASVNFTPPNGGIFKATVTTRDEHDNETSASARMWVSGSDYIAWRQSDDRSLELVTDKDTYSPGEEAEILIASPFPGENYALLTVERGHIRYSEVIRLENNSAVYKLPITSDMAPNIYISVTVITGAGENQMPDFRMGMAEIQVEAEQQALNVEITPDKTEAGPGDEVTYTIRTTDYLGEPVSAEISLALTDLATLTLKPANSDPILDFFYSPRSLSVRTAMPLLYSIEDYNIKLEEQLALGEGMGAGGGGSKGYDEFGVADVRRDFPDTAYWNGAIVTDENGEATVTVTLPDNLTTWRMDSRAVTVDTRVGENTEDIRSTKPLLVRPQTPRFFVVGDQAQLGAAIHNNSDEDLTITATLQAAGFTLSGDAAQEVEISAHQQAVVYWDGSVNTDVERVDLVFSVQGGEFSDASTPTLATLSEGGIPVYRYEVPETVGTSGTLPKAGSRTEGLSLPQGMGALTTGDLTIEIEPSLVAGMTAGLDYLEHYPYECIEQTISRFLPNVLTAQALQAAGRNDAALEANLDAQVNTALQRLYNWQNADGGWGWWYSLESDSLTSAYVVLGMAEAQRAGYAVSPLVFNQGVGYLRDHLLNIQSMEKGYLLNRQAFLLYALARAEQAANDENTHIGSSHALLRPIPGGGGGGITAQVVLLYEQRQSLSIYARAYLAQTIFMLDPEDARIETLISDFNNAAIRSATGTHWEEGWRDYWNWNTDTRTTAIVLGALIEIDPENTLNVDAVRWLMTHRSEGRWNSTQETAWSLMALTGWMQFTGELQADYQYAVALNGAHIENGFANADNLNETHQIRLDIAEMLSDEINRVTIARDDGPGALYYTAHLNVSLPVEQISALDRGIVISRSYFNPSTSSGQAAEDRQTPVTEAARGDILLARLTIVVPNALHYAIIDDHLPAGLEAVDQTLETSPQQLAPDRYNYDDMWQRGWGWWYFDHAELHDERVVLSADYLPAGTYVYTYLVRASTPGEFRVIPPTAQEFYFPEVYGRGEGSLFTVTP